MLEPFILTLRQALVDRCNQHIAQGGFVVLPSNQRWLRIASTFRLSGGRVEFQTPRSKWLCVSDPTPLYRQFKMLDETDAYKAQAS